MENFSTPRDALVPRLTNLLTIAVVFGAMAWSSAHRPVDERHEAAVGQTDITGTTEQALQVRHESLSNMHDERAPAQGAPMQPQSPQLTPSPAPSPSPSNTEPLGITQVKWDLKWDQKALPAQSNGFQAIGFVAAARH